jgi:hypothetical protein
MNGCSAGPTITNSSSPGATLPAVVSVGHAGAALNANAGRHRGAALRNAQALRCRGGVDERRRARLDRCHARSADRGIATALCSSSIGAHAASSPSSSLSSLIPGAVPKKFGDRFVKLRYRAQRRRYIGDKGHEVRPSLMRKAAIDCSLFP